MEWAAQTEIRIFNHLIRKYSLSSGAVTTVAGVKGSAGAFDGWGTYARFNGPHCLRFDQQGNIIISDHNNGRLRKMDTRGYVSTIISTGLSVPVGIAIDTINSNSNNNIILCNQEIHQIMSISTSGVMSTIIGSTIGYTANGYMGTYVQLNGPRYITIHSNGDYYFTEYTGSVIRRATSIFYMVTTIAGSYNVRSYLDGVGTYAQFNNPCGIVIDSSGVIIVNDASNHRIRRISNIDFSNNHNNSNSFMVSTIVGGNTAGYVDNGIGTNALLTRPFGLLQWDENTLYVGDYTSLRRLSYVIPTSQPSCQPSCQPVNRPTCQVSLT